MLLTAIVTEDKTNRPSFQELPVSQMSMKSTVYQCRIVMRTSVEKCLDHVPEALWVQFFHLDAVQGHQQISALDLVPEKTETKQKCLSYGGKAFGLMYPEDFSFWFLQVAFLKIIQFQNPDSGLQKLTKKSPYCSPLCKGSRAYLSNCYRLRWKSCKTATCSISRNRMMDQNP